MGHKHQHNRAETLKKNRNGKKIVTEKSIDKVPVKLPAVVNVLKTNTFQNLKRTKKMKPFSMCLLLALFIGASIAENEQESTLIKALKRQRITNTGGLRLVDSAGRVNYQNGRLEVYHNGQWGTVCDDKPDGMGTHALGEVVCRMLNFDGPADGYTKDKAYYGQGSGKIWLDDVKCTGTEQSIFDCTHSAWGTNDCSHSEDVGVYCNRRNE